MQIIKVPDPVPTVDLERAAAALAKLVPGATAHAIQDAISAKIVSSDRIRVGDWRFTTEHIEAVAEAIEDGRVKKR